MFLANLFCGSKEEKPLEALQTYRQVPKEQLQEYQFNKSRIRYENGIKASNLMPSMQMSFLKFRNNKPIDVIQANPQNLKQLMFQSNGKVVKKIIKSNYEQLVEKYKRNYQKFYDADFKPCPESIGKTFARKNCEWKRVTDIIPKAQFVSDDIAPQDILQGQLGNCYFLSAIAALAEHDFRIKNIFPKLQINKNGLYMARILHHGVYQEVVVDDFIPVDSRGRPIFAKPAGGKQIWVMILEKCWAKLFGSYEAIIGGLPNEVLHAFSAAPTFYHSITNNKAQQQELFQELVQAANDGAIMCCGTKSDSSIQRKGLVLGHAYSLIDVFEKPYRMLKIRNPWGERQWNGRASESDVNFWKKMNAFDADRLGHTFENDGTFFMLWEDFVQYFSMIDICRINDNAHYFSHQTQYLDDQAKMFELQTSGGDLVVTLSQRNIRGLDWREKKKGYANATMVIAKQVVQGSNVDYHYLDSGMDHTFSDYSIVLKNLQKGKYMIFSSMKWTGAEMDLATISVYTDSRVTLKQAPKLDPQDFLYKVFLDHARNNQENIQVIRQRPYEWACSDLLADKCGFGYLAFHVDKGSNRKIGLEIDESEYNNIKLELLTPYKGKGVFKLTAEPGKEVIVMFRLSPGNYGGSWSLPVPKMFLLY